MVFVPTETGHWVNENYARLSEIINEYDPNLQLAWIPPEHRTVSDTKPYAVVHTNPANGKQYTMFFLTEDEMTRPDIILSRVFNGDIKNGADPLARLEAEERGKQLMELKAKMEEAEERQEFIASVVGSHKHYFKHNGRVIPK